MRFLLRICASCCAYAETTELLNAKSKKWSSSSTTSTACDIVTYRAGAFAQLKTNIFLRKLVLSVALLRRFFLYFYPLTNILSSDGAKNAFQNFASLPPRTSDGSKNTQNRPLKTTWNLQVVFLGCFIPTYIIDTRCLSYQVLSSFVKLTDMEIFLGEKHSWYIPYHPASCIPNMILIWRLLNLIYIIELNLYLILNLI